MAKKKKTVRKTVKKKTVKPKVKLGTGQTAVKYTTTNQKRYKYNAERDAQISPAKRPGKRKTKWGTVYYETRVNRSDAKGSLTGVIKPKGIILSTLKAKEISSSWHGGQHSPLYQFASSGIFLPEKYLEYIFEINDNLKIAEPKEQRKLLKLKKYFDYKNYEYNK